MRHARHLAIALVGLLACGLWIGGCNTAKGAAEDLRQAGEATEHAVHDLTR